MTNRHHSVVGGTDAQMETLRTVENIGCTNGRSCSVAGLLLALLLFLQVLPHLGLAGR